MTTYCSTEDVKLYLGIADTESRDNTLIDKLISRATVIIETRTKRIFKEPTATSSRKYFISQCVDGLTLHTDDDILSIETLKDYSGTTIDLSTVILLPLNTLPKRSIKFKVAASKQWDYTDEDSQVEIIGKFAYSSTPPLDIVQACVRLTAWLYRQKDNSSDVDRPVLSGDGVVIMPQTLPQDIEVLLKPYIKETYGII